MNSVQLDPARLRRVKASFSVRRVNQRDAACLIDGDATPKAGDVVLARVAALGQHGKLQTTGGRRADLFLGDEILVAYGNRYAPDQFEAEVSGSLGPCDLVAGGGVAASMTARHQRMAAPTRLEPVGLLADRAGEPLNLRRYRLAKLESVARVPVIAVVGTSMNAGKSTTAVHVMRALRSAGHRVGVAKVTGTGAGGDPLLFQDAGADWVLDFTDAGFASTYRIAEADLMDVFDTLLGHLVHAGASAIVIEVADGILQQETALLLRSVRFRERVDGVIFAAQDAPGAIGGIAWLGQNRLRVLAVAGTLTSSPLAVREVRTATRTPVLTLAELEDPAVMRGWLDRTGGELPQQDLDEAYPRLHSRP